MTGKRRGCARSGALGLPGAGHVVQSGVLCVLAGDFLHELLLELSLLPCSAGNHEEPGPLAMVSRSESGNHLFDGGGMQAHGNRFLSLSYRSPAEAADLPRFRRVSELASRNAET